VSGGAWRGGARTCRGNLRAQLLRWDGVGWGWGGLMYIAGGRTVAFSLLLEDLRRRGAADLWVSLEDSHHGLECRSALENVEATGPLLRRAGRAGGGGGQGMGRCRPPRERQGDGEGGEGSGQGGRGRRWAAHCVAVCQVYQEGKRPQQMRIGAAILEGRHLLGELRQRRHHHVTRAGYLHHAPRGVGGRVAGGLLGLRGSRLAGSPS
jgi:hypothetical protein